MKNAKQRQKQTGKATAEFAELEEELSSVKDRLFARAHFRACDTESVWTGKVE